MNQYSFYQDQKVTIWQRHYFTVQAESLEKAQEIITDEDLSSDFIGDLADGQTVVSDKSEYLYDTVSDMNPEDNQGYATTIVLDTNHKTLCLNGRDPLLDR